MAEPVTTYGIIALVGSTVLMWIREIRKGKNEKGNNKDMKAVKTTVTQIDEKVDCMDKKLTETNTKISERKDTCNNTVARFNKQFGDVQKEILELAKQK